MTHGCLKNLVVLMFCTMLVGTTRSCLQFEYVLRTDQGEECCPKCVPGHRVKTHCTEWQSTSCIACDEGTYMDKYNGEKQCFQCLNCAEGTGLREISSCINTRNTVCEPLEGFFCVSGSVDRCVAAQQHSTCAPGRYISTAGTSSTDTVCGDCSEGTFSDGTFKSCQNHTQCSRLQQPGTISSDSVCVEGLTPGEWAGLVAAGISAGICVPLCLLSKRICCKRKETREPRVFHANNATCEALVDEAAPPLPSAVVLTDKALLDDAGADVLHPPRMDQLSWGT
ncbi:tumor necrosis factor receptor superfamily member 14-like isoform X6 [Synchiropus splendidus]|uniref:tumor necrosis factor receptor superfamily member 14-like isoform X6 n=1 Tax=Synchiropus splendidus TaxID=270530 RepID=UPI00237EAD32|nr:tumor necrosis factor receptor superfamily member 14-like isoform X6 [Synchiropus splendidus]